MPKRRLSGQNGSQTASSTLDSEVEKPTKAPSLSSGKASGSKIKTRSKNKKASSQVSQKEEELPQRDTTDPDEQSEQSKPSQKGKTKATPGRPESSTVQRTVSAGVAEDVPVVLSQPSASNVQVSNVHVRPHKEKTEEPGKKDGEEDLRSNHSGNSSSGSPTPPGSTSDRISSESKVQKNTPAASGQRVNDVSGTKLRDPERDRNTDKRNQLIEVKTLLENCQSRVADIQVDMAALQGQLNILESDLHCEPTCRARSVPFPRQSTCRAKFQSATLKETLEKVCTCQKCRCHVD